jgi:hypothetical protein
MANVAPASQCRLVALARNSGCGHPMMNHHIHAHFNDAHFGSPTAPIVFAHAELIGDMKVMRERGKVCTQSDSSGLIHAISKSTILGF